MSYFASNEVTVFPSTKRANADARQISSKQMLEMNVIKTAANLLDVDSFVKYLDGNKYLVMLGGYIFEINKELSGNVYVGINVQNGELQGQDVSNQYQGLTYSTSDLTSMTYHIQLLANGSVPESSKLKYNIENLFYINNGNNAQVQVNTALLDGNDVIDGGTIGTV